MQKIPSPFDPQWRDRLALSLLQKMSETEQEKLKQLALLIKNILKQPYNTDFNGWISLLSDAFLVELSAQIKLLIKNIPMLHPVAKSRASKRSKMAL